MIRQVIAPIRARFNIRRHPFARKFLPVMLISAVVFVLLAMIDKRLGSLSVHAHFFILLAVALALGILLAWLFERKLFLDKSRWHRSLLILGLTVWGLLLFVLALTRFRLGSLPSVYGWVYLPALSMVMLPWFVWRAVVALAEVPLLRFAPYVFESLKDVVAANDFTGDQHRGFRWVFMDDFVEVDPSGTYTFRTFAPKKVKEISLHMLFKSTISLHNVTELPQSPIDFRSKEGFYGWEFYHYPLWWWPQRKRYLNPLITVEKNRIRFRYVPEEVRAKSSVPLPKNFHACTVYVTRTHSIEP